MTRDQAIKIADEAWKNSQGSIGADYVTVLAALGVLKLDEPKDAIQRLADEISWTLAGLEAALRETGLCIVEADK